MQACPQVYSGAGLRFSGPVPLERDQVVYVQVQGESLDQLFPVRTQRKNPVP